MDLSQLSSNATSGSSGVQGMSGGGHHHHHKSISDQVSQMGSAIDQAVSAGTMTSDQATTLKNELADITQTLGQTSQTSSTATTASGTGTTGQTNPLSQLSDADRKKVFGELQDVRKQLHAAFSSQDANAASGASGSDAVSNLFSQLDTNNNGSIDKNELTQFLAQIGADALGGYNQQGNTSAASSAVGGSIFSATA